MRPRLLAACLGVAGVACLVVANVNRKPEIEGLYFVRVDGGTGYAPVERSIFDPFDPWNGYLWLGAGLAFVLAALAVSVLAAVRGSA